MFIKLLVPQLLTFRINRLYDTMAIARARLSHRLWKIISVGWSSTLPRLHQAHQMLLLMAVLAFSSLIVNSSPCNKLAKCSVTGLNGLVSASPQKYGTD